MRVTRCANAGPVSLAHKGLPLPHCMQDILPSNLRKNFSYLALLAMQHYRLAFQNSFSVWTTYEIDPYCGSAHGMRNEFYLNSNPV